MLSIRRQFNAEIKYIAQENGFKKITVPRMGETYCRVTEEILQVFELRNYSFQTCDVDISVLPIRGEINEHSFICAVEPIMLTELAGINFAGFTYERQNEESIISCAQRTVEMFNKLAIPFLNGATTNYRALSKLFNVSYQRFGLYSFLNMNKLYMALNTKNTAVALNCCYSWIEHYKDYLRGKYVSMDSKEMVKEKIKMFEKYVEKLKLVDYNFFDPLLDTLEKNSREIISKKIETVWKV